MRSQADLRATIRSSESAIAGLEAQLAAATAAIARRRDTFRMTVEGQPTSKRPEAESLLKAALTRLLASYSTHDGTWTEVGRLGGFAVAAQAQRAMTLAPALTVALRDVPDGEIRLTAEQIGESALVARLENRLTGLEHFRDETAVRIERLRAEVRTAGDLLCRPFPRAADLVVARARVQDLNEQLKAIANRQVEDAVSPARTVSEATTDSPGGHCPSVPPSSQASERSERRREWARQSAAAHSIVATPQASRLGAVRTA